jgi:hypothetical protein
LHPHGGGGGGGQAGAGGGGGGHFGDGSTNTQVFLITGGWHGSASVLSIIFGAGFLGCSVTLSMIVCGWRVTLTLSMVSPGGVGFLFTSLLTIGGGVGSLTLSTFLLGGETLQSLPHGGGGGGDGGGGHPQDIFIVLFCWSGNYSVDPS